MRHRADRADRSPSRRLRVGIGAAVVLVLAAFAVAVLVSAAANGGGVVPLPGSAVSGTASAPETSRALPGAATTDAPSTDAAGEVFVHVSGAVRSPGLVSLRRGARVVDAIAAADGLSDDADPAGVNLARPVQDGEQLRVPRLGEAPAAAAPVTGVGESGPDPAAGAPVDLNTATQAQLETLPRIGPALAQRILDWRSANGRFAAVTDLMKVAGIGQKVFDGLKDKVTV